jgi:hypothetical protein
LGVHQPVLGLKLDIGAPPLGCGDRYWVGKCSVRVKPYNSVLIPVGCILEQKMVRSKGSNPDPFKKINGK